MKINQYHLLNLLALFPFLSILAQAPTRSNDSSIDNQQFLSAQYTVEQGLSNNDVTSMLQDNRGFLWVGTRDGLNKFDGYDFTVFKHQPAETASISNSEISAIHEDRDGHIWVATQGGLNCYDPKTETFSYFQHDPFDGKSISHNYVKAIYEDHQGILWIGTQNGLNKFDKKTKSFTHYQHQADHFPVRKEANAHQINVINESTPGELIIGYWGVGIMAFDKNAETFRQIHVDQEDLGLQLWVNGMSKDKHGELWISAAGKVYQYKEAEKQIPIPLKQEDGAAAPFCFVPSSTGHYLSGTHSRGFYILDQKFQAIRHFLPEPTDNEIPTNKNWIHTAIEDSAGDIWIGTAGAGIFHLIWKGNPFTNLIQRPNLEKKLSDFFITDLLEVEEDIVWASTGKYGISVFNKKNNQFSALPESLHYPQGLNTNEVKTLYQDSKKNIWIGTWGGGLNFYHTAIKSFDYFLADYDDLSSLSDNFITTILETQEEEIWIGTTHGISVLPNEEAIIKKKFKRYRPVQGDPTTLNNFWVTAIIQTQSGHIWVGTEDGLHLFDRERDEFKLIKHDPENLQSLINNGINSIFEDSQGHLWIGTKGGLNKMDIETGTFTWFTEKDGLANDYIRQIQEDKNGQLWMSTNKGLSRFNPKTKLFKNYNIKDGLFNFTPFFFSTYSDFFYGGGSNGLSLFHPDSIQDNSYIPPIIISSFKKLNTKEGQIKEIEIKGISWSDEIELSYLENIISIEVTALNFQNSEKNQYAYQLEGFNNTWINNGENREITFTNLDPGDYTLRVVGSNNDARWNETGQSLKIKIIPPWWNTGWAYLLYFLIGNTLLYISYRILLRREELQYQLKLEKEEAIRLKELDSFKSKLYTNLTHEFRTPLTVILGMVGQIREQPKKHLAEGTRLIESNGKNLLKLINQLLDLSKLEDKSFQLNMEQGDIVPYLRYITESFQTYANSRNLSLRFFTTLESMVMDYDVEQIKQILTNLISNAVKFTPSGGEVLIRLSSKIDQADPALQSLKIEIKDSGIGIAQKDLPHVFNRFYQVDSSTTRSSEGTGIGLAHTMELVKLFGGSLSANSEPGKGTSFFVSLPISKKAPMIQTSMAIKKANIKTDKLINGPSFISAPKFSKPSPATGDHLAHLLIIVDNHDVVVYLKSCLEGLYQIDVAYNGKIGIEKALENIPDLIISDVLMPEKDGYQVCDSLKNDERTSHIPIILLTAKADAASKLAGLKRGADAYLSKPFDREEMLIRLEVLLKDRRQMAAKFSIGMQQNGISDELTSDEQIEDQFIQKIKHLIGENMKDENFALPQLCQKLRMSRSQLFRKMKALINVSPSQFIRSHRLHSAKELLESSALNVSEVAWKVGFKDISHFTKVYKEEYGELPSSTRK